jgi:hypothetical protein
MLVSLSCHRRGVISIAVNIISTTTTTLLLSLLLLLLAGRNANNSSVSAASTNPYSSNVIALTSSNWKEIVLNNKHSVFVNICRIG